MPSPRRFVGGMNVPRARGTGRVNASIPLASLVLDGDGITLAPRSYAALLTGPFRVTTRDVVVAYRLSEDPPSGNPPGTPVSGSYLSSNRLRSGVGVDLRDGRSAYFWTTDAQNEVLGALAAAGVAVDPVPRPPTAAYERRGRSRSSPAFQEARSISWNLEAPLPSWVIRVLPLVMVAATILMFVFEATFGTPRWRVVIAVAWIVWMVRAFRLWRRSRATG